MLARNKNVEPENIEIPSKTSPTRIEKMMSVGWFGQVLASMFWILSVFSYGITTSGDWLQLLAASSWMMSNIAVIISIE